MKRRLTNEEQEQLDVLKERLLLTLHFFENAQDFKSAPRYRAHVERAAHEGNLRAMRLMAREIEQMSIALTVDQRDGLEALLKERLGIDKDAERAALSQQVAQVLTRSRIASEKERRRLEDYAEMLEAIGGDPSELEALRSFLRQG